MKLGVLHCIWVLRRAGMLPPSSALAQRLSCSSPSTQHSELTQHAGSGQNEDMWHMGRFSLRGWVCCHTDPCCGPPRGAAMLITEGVRYIVCQASA